MEKAFFGLPDGRLAIGEGPFEARSKPPQDGVAFYINDFRLSDPKPWKVPAELLFREVSKEDDASYAHLDQVEWEEPHSGAFAEVFGHVMEEIRAGRLEKAVPVSTAIAPYSTDLKEKLLHRLGVVSSPLRAYGCLSDGSSFVGATPELLFTLKGKSLSTMALAGTAKQEDRVIFEVDEKEQREHEFVAQTLLAKLADLGEAQRYPREVLDLGSIVHYHTAIDVELVEVPPPESLIKKLHPTPALGPLPRTIQTLNLLHSWRQKLGCPETFGSPFGFWSQGEFEVLVAIRMVSWDEDHFYLPSGCGLIEESRLLNEWRELRLKRNAVCSAFSI